jgi:hypothetical protein
MSHRTIHRCDACGVEYEDVEHALNVIAARATPNWGHFSLGGGGSNYLGSIPTIFDLCETCVAKVVAALGLKVPPPVAQDDWPVPMGSCRPNIVRRHLQPVPGSSGLTVEDLKELGLDVNGLQANVSSTIDDPNFVGSWQARDAATGEVLLRGHCGTKKDFLDALSERYGADWVLGTDQHPARLIVEPIKG